MQQPRQVNVQEVVAAKNTGIFAEVGAKVGNPLGMSLEANILFAEHGQHHPGNLEQLFLFDASGSGC